MKTLTFLFLFYMYYFLFSAFVWCIAPYEFGEITSYPGTIIVGGILSLGFAGLTLDELKEKGKL